MAVKMTHPDLAGREIEVPEQSVVHHERAGWRRSEGPKKKTHRFSRGEDVQEKQDSTEGDQS